jgi:membrane protein
VAFVRFILFWADTTNDFLNKNCPYIAGAIAFYALFSMFPLILAIVSVLGFVLGPTAPQGQQEFAREIADVLPVSSEYVADQVQRVVGTRAITGVASFFALLWLSSATFGAIRKGINAAWGIKKPRPYIKERLIDIGLVLGAGVVFLIVLFGTAALGLLKEVTQVLAPESEVFSTVVWNMLSKLLAPGLSFVTFLILYRFLPNTVVRVRDIWPGALLASLAFSAANWSFVWYVTTFPHSYNVLYGSVGGVLALLTWVYVSAIIVLYGALLTSRYAAWTVDTEAQGANLRLLLTGFTRVRLRVVESTGTG